MTTLVLLSALGVLVVAGVVVAGYRIHRRVSRYVTRTRARVAAVQAKVQPPGPRRDAALLRQRLQVEMRATRELLANTPDGLIFRASATTVLQELATTAADVEAQLAAIDGFLDQQQQRLALDAVRQQAEQLIATTYTARQTVLQTAVEDRARRIAALQADVAQQAAALEVYRNGDGDLRL